MSLNKSEIKNTFKSEDTEEYLDKVFYRPFGYYMALISKKLGITPNGVTIFSIFVGVLAGHLFYYQNLWINVIGILLLIWAEGLDSADGQLARMTNHKSRFGRILDGVGGNLWYISIYIHLCLRLINTGLSPAIFIIAVIAGISQSLQCAVADHYRNFYTYFVHGKEKSEIDDSSSLAIEYPKLSWSKNFWKKFLMRMYINYTIEQEFVSRNTIILMRYFERYFDSKIPDGISTLFREKNKRLIKYYNILTSNTRMIVLFIALILNNIYIFAFFQIICLNLLLIYVVAKHEANSKAILSEAILIIPEAL
jgi:phosphatidylglycerophosphate synthase